MTLETGYGATSNKKDVGKYKCIDSRRILIFTRIQEINNDFKGTLPGCWPSNC